MKWVRISYSKLIFTQRYHSESKLMLCMGSRPVSGADSRTNECICARVHHICTRAKNERAHKYNALVHTYIHFSSNQHEKVADRPLVNGPTVQIVKVPVDLNSCDHLILNVISHKDNRYILFLIAVGCRLLFCNLHVTASVQCN